MRVEDGYSAVRRAPVVGLRGQAEGCVGADDGLARIGMRGPIFRGTIAASAELANSSCTLSKPFHRIRMTAPVCVFVSKPVPTAVIFRANSAPSIGFRTPTPLYNDDYQSVKQTLLPRRCCSSIS